MDEILNRLKILRWKAYEKDHNGPIVKELDEIIKILS